MSKLVMSNEAKYFSEERKGLYSRWASRSWTNPLSCLIISAALFYFSFPKYALLVLFRSESNMIQHQVGIHQLFIVEVWRRLFYFPIPWFLCLTSDVAQQHSFVSGFAFSLTMFLIGCYATVHYFRNLMILENESARKFTPKPATSKPVDSGQQKTKATNVNLRYSCLHPGVLCLD